MAKSPSDVNIADDQPAADPDTSVSLEAALSGAADTPEGFPPPEAGNEIYESNNVNDEEPPAVVETFNASMPEVGQFVGLGVEQVSVGAGEFLVDPATGLITGPV